MGSWVHHHLRGRRQKEDPQIRLEKGTLEVGGRPGTRGSPTQRGASGVKLRAQRTEQHSGCTEAFRHRGRHFREVAGSEASMERME